MKTSAKITYTIMVVAIAFASCKKDSTSTNSSGSTTSPTTTTTTTTPPATGTVLLTSIIDNNPGDKDFTIIDPINSYKVDSISTGYGQPIFQFTYSGTQLIKAVRYYSSKSYQTYVFSYDTQGHCTGSTISTYLNGQMLTGAQVGDTVAVSSVISYSGNYIGEQKFYTTKNALYDDVTYTWQNSELLYLTDNPSAIAGYTPYVDTYIYDANNNNDSFILTNGLIPLNSGSGGAPNSFPTFDNNNNFSSAFPLWWIILGPNSGEASFAFGPLGNDANNPNADIIDVIPGAHNPLSDFFGDTYAYQYNSYNYPSVETVTNGGLSESVKYNYIKAN